jgi:solute carrier family 8 (sodium/calcium exchanger)
MVTSISSIFAYLWVYIALSVSSPEEITIAEAFLTFIFFIVLIVLAYGADK